MSNSELSCSPIQATKRYVWLNINDGKFSRSWTDKDHEIIGQERLEQAAKDGWKLIEYKCLNDDKFELYNKMRLR